MDTLSQVVTGLRLARPSLDAAQLLALVNPEPVAEQRVVAEIGLPYWVYSVDGKSFDGYFITVRAALPAQADQLAMSVLKDLIDALREEEQNTGLHVEAEARPMQ